jgi:hypothetical protein
VLGTGSDEMRDTAFALRSSQTDGRWNYEEQGAIVHPETMGAQGVRASERR